MRERVSVPFAVILIGLFVICFLLGSIPSGVLISRLFYHRDVRQYGSGNIGTTNAFRALGKVGGSVVFILDFGKGLLSGLIAMWLCQWMGVVQPGNPLPIEQPVVQILYATSFLGCIWGHIFSPWLRFKGGKGIAVAVGCEFVVFNVWGALLELAIFAVCVVATRKVSVGSIAASVACPFIALYLFWGNWLAWLLITIAAVTVIWAHRGNIERLAHHEESTIGGSSKHQVECQQVDTSAVVIESVSETAEDANEAAVEDIRETREACAL